MVKKKEVTFLLVELSDIKSDLEFVKRLIENTLAHVFFLLVQLLFILKQIFEDN